MQDSFSVRVGKTFDSLPCSSWSLGDEQIDRRECNRDKDSPVPESELHKYNTNPTDDFGNELENGLYDFFDDEYLVEEEELHGSNGQSTESKANPKTKPDDYDEEQWDIKTSIGLDLTLDYEDEEDGYDRFAVGIEDFVGHSDMNKYVNDDHEIDNDEVPNLLKGFTGDTLENGIKTLLKRMSIDDHLVSSTRAKRVRFATKRSMKDQKIGGQQQFRITCVRNPSRYTHYTFDSSDDMDDKSNNQAYLNLRMQLLRLMKSDTVEGLEAKDDAYIGVPNPVASVPIRKKSTDASKIALGIIRPTAFPDVDDCEMG